MLLVIDNYDSFTFNLVQFLGDLGADPLVVRNDERDVDALLALRPDRVVVSPGPCTPAEAGVSIESFRTLGAEGIPMLGVCLGHQSLGEAFGGRTVRAQRIMHGKTGPIEHGGDGLFEGIPSPFQVARYHSLVSDGASLPGVLEPIAWSTDPRTKVKSRRCATVNCRSGAFSSIRSRSSVSTGSDCCTTSCRFSTLGR